MHQKYVPLMTLRTHRPGLLRVNMRNDKIEMDFQEIALKDYSD